MKLGSFRGVAAALVVAGALTACASEEKEVVVVHEARPARPCAGGVWVAGHYGRRGGWHAGHWRCPGVVEVVEVD